MASEIRVNQIQNRTGVGTITIGVSSITMSEETLHVGSAVTISSGIISATSFSGDGSNLSGIDATQIQTGNTSVQTVDTGSDGHVIITTEGTERVRVGAGGSVGIGTDDPSFELHVEGTGATQLPAGTNAQRPGSLGANDRGVIRYNTESGRFEYWSTTSDTPQWRLIAQDPVNSITATGGSVSTSGGKKIHTFTSSSSTFEITEGSGDVEYLVVAGGGGGGGNNGNEDATGGSGGGGAGGLLAGTLTSLGPGQYTITVGAGGAGGNSNSAGSDGGNSSIVAGNITDVVATGGGGGGWGQNGTSPNTNGRDGGSGGGGGTHQSSTTTAGSGTVGQGNDGGTGTAQDNGGGGGGAGAAGGNAGGLAGDGGDGTSSSITGTSVTYAGGGGGSRGGGEATTGAGGSGGGGAGAIRNTSNAVDGTDGRGSGGGGATDSSVASESIGGDGGDGIVILSYTD